MPVSTDGATLCGNTLVGNGARWPEKDRALRVGVGAGHLPTPRLEPLPLRVAASERGAEICPTRTADAARETSLDGVWLGYCPFARRTSRSPG